MSPEEKAKEILTKIEVAFYGKSYAPNRYSRKIVKLALLLCDEMWNALSKPGGSIGNGGYTDYQYYEKYWQQVRHFIEKN